MAALNQRSRERVHEARTSVKKLRGLGVELRLDVGDRLSEALADGLSDTYRWGRKAMATAYDRARDADFHEWRKATRYHGYHVRLLADVWPEALGGRRDVLDRLGELLGEDHDLAVFAETLSREPRCFDSRQDQLVLIGQRQQALRALARPLGRRLFAEPPSAFKRRLHEYWKLWRDRPPGA